MKEFINSYQFKKYFAIGVILHLVAAYFSVGFLHFDEHFQILEFLNYKLGGIPANELATEFHLKMRPWSQTYVLYFFYKIFMFNDPFLFAFFGRVLSSVIGLFSLFLMSLYFMKEFAKEKILLKWVNPILIFTWFFPYFHARNSSDHWGAAFLIIGVCLYLLRKDISDRFEKIKIMPSLLVLISGLVLGASFHFRYQIGISVFSFFLWILIFKSYDSKKEIILFLVGVLAAVFLGLVIDYWGYGEMVIAPLNYIQENLIHGMASSMGTTPWWDYFRLAFLRGYPPLSLILILGTLWFWFKNLKNPFTFILIPFFIVHMLIGHKELRFLMPIIYLSPLFLLFSLSEGAIEFLKKDKKTWAFFLRWIILPLNVALLLLTSLKPAKVSVATYEIIKNHLNGLTKIYYVGEKPFYNVGIPLRFYWPKDLEILSLNSTIDLKEVLETEKKLLFLVSRYDQFKEMENFKECKLEYSTYPSFMINLNIGNWIKRSTLWQLYRCQKIK